MNFIYDEVLENHYNEIFHYVYKQVNNTEDAKDLTQDIFLKVFENREKYDPNKSSIRTWLYAIAHHITINHQKLFYQKNRRYLEEWLMEIKTSDEDVVERLIQKESVKEIIILMNQLLNKKHLRIMNLYFFSNLKVSEIANTLHIPIQTVSNAIQRSIQKIKLKLEVIQNG